jgi:TetR/AcrR family transcriptional regulator, tetracycline repressor protein
VSGVDEAAPRRRLSRDDVAAEALRILDEDGLPDLTMRRLAAALDVQPSALYWHFASKQDIIAELSDRILARTPAPHAGEDWAESLHARALALRDALLAYRDGAEVVASTLALGLGTVRPRDAFARAIEDAGFAPDTAVRAATALMHFVLGHVSHEQERMQYESLGVRADAGDDDSAPDFRFGVDLFIAGLAALRPAGRD